MTTDLWGFKNEKDLEKETRNFPEPILKEQISLLGEKTGFVLYGKPLYMKINRKDIEYKAATVFNVVVPALDDYNKTVLILYSNFEENFPVAITVGKSFAEDMECFKPMYRCNNIMEFKETLREILYSEEVMDVIKTLYSKANMLGNINY